MLEYYRHYKRKAQNAKEIVPVFFYNVGLILWRMGGCDLYLWINEMKGKIKTKHEKIVTTDIPMPKTNDKLLDKDIEAMMSEIENNFDEETVDIEGQHFTSQESSLEQSSNGDITDLLLLRRTFFLEEIITTPYIETLKRDMFEFKAEDGKAIILTCSDNTLLLGVEKPGEFISLSSYKYQREGHYSGEVLIIIDKVLYSHFSYIEDIGDKIKTITRFASCTEDQQRLIINTASKSRKDMSATTSIEKSSSGCRNVIKDKKTLK